MALSAALILSGLTQEQFSGELQDIFNHGAVLLKSPSTSSIASSGTISSYHSESGISSMSTDSSVASGLEMYIDIISKLEERFQQFGETTIVPEENVKVEEVKILHNGRDILNLLDNIMRNDAWMFAKLPNGVDGFFENRSQYSRVSGADLPRHVTVECKQQDCDFKEPHYY